MPKKYNKREPELFKEEFRLTERLCFSSKTYDCYDSLSNKFKSSRIGLSQQTFEDSGEGPLTKN